MKNSLSTPYGQSLEAVLGCLVYGGRHPYPWVDGWLMQFKFANGLIASVIQYRAEVLMEVGVRDDDWLYEVVEDLTGKEVIMKLFEVMERSIA